MAEHHSAIVVGGGQSALATAYYLRKYGVDFLILDDQDGPGAAWRHVWPSMTLFSASEFSNLPGWPMPHYPGFPPAQHVVEYLAEYERRYDLPVKRPVHVDRVGHDGAVFRLDTTAGAYTADALVAATGTWSAPFVPFYPGTFAGEQWHSAHYPGPEPFRGARVAVVGGGNSGAQIAAELTEVADVTWYTRKEPRWMPDDVDGRVLFRRNRQRVLAIQRGEPDPGADSNLGDIVALPQVREARDSGRLTATPMFDSLHEVDADHLIWCTGFRPALEPVRSLLDAPIPLFLVGYGDLVGPGAATITGVAPFAKRAAQGVANVSRETSPE
ncbi:NAD(P)-binding domain-containing protein [Corynebacterium auris]|uniref:NAD(P)-binding domain-containing protein n=1 Tax=Corynebacterium auris TaxID=44750 RepID=UPI0025B454F9|nr:NAD(P)-binding domain-containing protein [Corynebacterium auris]WJY69111.1 putative oxidoreductase CzcO [Corynebacterium auris]